MVDEGNLISVFSGNLYRRMGELGVQRRATATSETLWVWREPGVYGQKTPEFSVLAWREARQEAGSPF